MVPDRFSELYGGMLSASQARAADPTALATKPNGTGPFMVTEWLKNERLVLEANPSYWRGPASVSKITMRPILEDCDPRRGAPDRRGRLHQQRPLRAYRRA